jgi:hypothetical protein
VVAPFTRCANQLTRLDRWLCHAVLPAQPAVVIEGDEGRDE